MSSWLDRNQTAEKGEFEDKQKELEKVCMPKSCTRQEVCPMEQEECQEVHLHGSGGKKSQGPTIEEVD